MRELFLKDKFVELGFSFTERYGVSVGAKSARENDEYNAIRNNVGLTDFTYMQKFSIPEETGIDYLNEIFASDIESLRFGKVQHTFLANDQGQIIADCYIVNNDDEFLILCESLVHDSELKKILFEDNRGSDFGLKDLTEDHIILSIDGYNSWKVMKELFGVSILGLPYLSIEEFEFDNQKVFVLRVGKTGEFGYYILAQNGVAESLFNALSEKMAAHNGAICGLDVHNTLRLDGRFFNIFAEGKEVKNPLYLGLQWMIDLENMRFIGSDTISKQRDAGVDKKVIGITLDKSIDGVRVGGKIFDEEKEIGNIVATAFSPVLDKHIALALLPFEMAYAGLTYYYEKPLGDQINTVSMPPFSPKSLQIKLD